MINPLRAQGGAEDIGVNVVKAALNVKKQRRDLECWALQSTDCVCKGSACVKRRKRGEGATLIAVEEANLSGNG